MRTNNHYLKVHIAYDIERQCAETLQREPKFEIVIIRVLTIMTIITCCNILNKVKRKSRLQTNLEFDTLLRLNKPMSYGN